MGGLSRTLQCVSVQKWRPTMLEEHLIRPPWFDRGLSAVSISVSQLSVQLGECGVWSADISWSVCCHLWRGLSPLHICAPSQVYLILPVFIGVSFNSTSRLPFLFFFFSLSARLLRFGQSAYLWKTHLMPEVKFGIAELKLFPISVWALVLIYMSSRPGVACVLVKSMINTSVSQACQYLTPVTQRQDFWLLAFMSNFFIFSPHNFLSHHLWLQLLILSPPFTFLSIFMIKALSIYSKISKWINKCLHVKHTWEQVCINST